jgi:hypothetical protein
MANTTVEVLHLLNAFFPLCGEAVNPFYRCTPLHLAVNCSSSLALVRELIHLYPRALDMGDLNGNIPLHWVQTKSSEAPQILQALLDAAPQTARTMNLMRDLPLHASPVVLEMVPILLSAYPDAVDKRGCDRNLPIHMAAASASVQVLQMIAEENMANLSAVTDDGYGRSVAHLAVRNKNLENLRYIQLGQARAVAGEGSERRSGDERELAAFQSPDDHLYDDLSSPMSVGSEILRFLLCHYKSIVMRRMIHMGI